MSSWIASVLQTEQTQGGKHNEGSNVEITLGLFLTGSILSLYHHPWSIYHYTYTGHLFPSNVLVEAPCKKLPPQIADADTGQTYKVNRLKRHGRFYLEDVYTV